MTGSRHGYVETAIHASALFVVHHYCIMYHLHSTRYLWSQAADRCRCCCCCCGNGDRDRDFCIYKNLFLAAVWIVVGGVGVCLANILFLPPLCWPGLLPRRLDQLRVLAGLHQLLHQSLHLRRQVQGVPPRLPRQSPLDPLSLGNLAP